MQIAIDLPDDFVSFQSAADIGKDMRLSYSLWLFKNARVTLAKAAELGDWRFMILCPLANRAGWRSLTSAKEELAGMRPL